LLFSVQLNEAVSQHTFTSLGVESAKHEWGDIQLTGSSSK